MTHRDLLRLGSRRPLRAVATLLVTTAPLLVACSDATTTGTSSSPAPCTAGDPAEDVSGCEAGIPPERCGAGFEPDGAMGCEPVLPAEPCPAGEMAVPGDSACRPVASCADGTFGDIPVEADTQFVDGSYAGGGSDGSQGQPWTTIAEGIAAAEPGAIVAIAAGSYGEDLGWAGKAVRLWGRCPELVEIAGTGQALAAVTINAGADLSELRSVAITGAGGGVRVEGSQDVLLHSLWLHDLAGRGMALQQETAAVSATVEGCLIDSATVIGVQVAGADLTMVGTVVRSTDEADPGGVGQGVVVQPHPTSAAPATASIQGSLLERNHGAAALAIAAQLSLETTVIRATQPSTLDNSDGVGVVAIADAGARPTLSIATSVVERNHTRGISVFGGDATISATHVRDVFSQISDDRNGEGIALQDDGAERSAGTIEHCLVERSRQTGILIRGSDGTLQSTLVRGTEPRSVDDDFGRGVAVLREKNHGIGASGTVVGCRIEDNHAFGIYAADAALIVDDTFIHSTQVQRSDGEYGAGIALITFEPELGTTASLALSHSRIDDNAWAGVLSFGSAVSMEQTTLDCNPHELRGRSHYLSTESPYSFEDRGHNLCGCGTTRTPCVMGD